MPQRFHLTSHFCLICSISLEHYIQKDSEVIFGLISGLNGKECTRHNISVVVIESIEHESQFLEEVRCISSCFNNKQHKLQFQWLMNINTYFSSHRESGCGLDLVCSTFLLIPGFRQKDHPSFGICCAVERAEIPMDKPNQTITFKTSAQT